MLQEIEIKIKQGYENEYRNGYPLLTQESIEDRSLLRDEGVILNLYCFKNKFIAKAYYGLQNKGYGWLISLDKDEKIDKSFFKKKIYLALKYRASYFSDASTTAFRVFNGEGDGLGGLSIDYYEGYYLLTWYSLGIYEFRDLILDALKESVQYKGIYQKKRFDSKGKYLDEKDDYICGQKAPKSIIVKENNVNFAIHLDDGAMVGVFLDQREVRNIIKTKYADNKNFLNTFSYTGAFSVFAALGGASTTTSVDLAKRSLLKTQEQFEINDIDLDAQEIIVEDVFLYFKYALRKNLEFDMIVLDPPSFARSKKHTFSAAKDYKNLLKETILITKKGGVIVASTNAANFGMMKFREFITKAFKELGGRFEVLESYSLPKDFKVDPKFKEANYLKVVFIKKIK